MKALLRPVDLPIDLIGQRAPCDLFNARGVLLVSADSVIGHRAGNHFYSTRVFCQADQAARISDFNPFVELERISKNLAGIAERIARNETVFPSELTNLSRTLYDAWTRDADACLGYAHHCKSNRPSISHVVLVSLLAAELATAHRLDREQCASFIGGALTMNLAKLSLHDEMYACSDRPSPEQLSEIRLHPSESMGLLEHIGTFEKSWLDAVGSHHENIDGSGYPRALKGDDIALSARLVKVADIYAARLTGRKVRRPVQWNIQRTRDTRTIVQHIFGGDQQRLDPPLTTQLIAALGRIPPGSLVRLNNMELAVVTRRIPGDLETPREALSIQDSAGCILKTPRRRKIGLRDYQIKYYANDESQQLTSCDWQKIWGYSS